MKWDDGQQSDNIEDVRGSSGGGGLPFGGRAIGIGTVVIALIGSYFFGIDPSVILGMAGGGSEAPVQQAPRDPGQPQADDPQKRFVSRILLDTEQTWSGLFAQNNATYRAPKLDIFSGAYGTACGQGVAASGPFYCPGDEKVYIDLAFFRLLEQRFKAPGDFAQAYVIAHEVGHHVQKLLGITDKTDAMRRRMSETDYNRVSVRVGAAGRLLRGHLGASPRGRTERHQARPGRRRRGAAGGDRDRRRHAAKAGPRHRRAGQLHARLVGPARDVVQARHGFRRPAPVRHVRRRRTLTSGPWPAAR